MRGPGSPCPECHVGVLYTKYPNRGNPGSLLGCTDCDHTEALYG